MCGKYEFVSVKESRWKTDAVLNEFLDGAEGEMILSKFVRGESNLCCLGVLRGRGLGKKMERLFVPAPYGGMRILTTGHIRRYPKRVWKYHPQSIIIPPISFFVVVRKDEKRFEAQDQNPNPGRLVLVKGREAIIEFLKQDGVPLHIEKGLAEFLEMEKGSK